VNVSVNVLDCDLSRAVNGDDGDDGDSKNCHR
jgi:hypothetical protein